MFSIALISAAALAYEILQMRLFSIIQWHHFAYMMISLALLGFGASGTFLVLARNWLQGRYRSAFIVNAAAFGLTSVLCFLAAQSLPFNALALVWDPRQLLWLLLIYLLLFLPFFCAANCICLSFSEFRDRVYRVYSADLLGAGAGAVAIIGLLFHVPPLAALGLVGALGWLAAALACLELRLRRPRTAALLLLGSVLSLLPAAGAELKLSEFKGLSQALRVTGAGELDRRSGPLGMLTTVQSPVVPFRHAPGLSLNTPVEPPPQLAVFTDGDAMSVITDPGDDPARLAYLDFTSTALPYHLLDRPGVLVLGAGGGADVLQALHLGAAHVDAVELNRQMLDLVRTGHRAFSGGIYEDPRVRAIVREARGFVAAGDGRYDLVQLALLDSFAASAAGLYALSENYLYTVEAFTALLDRLAPGGLVAVTRWLKLPPRDGLKVFATAVAALEQRGVSRPGDHLALIRSWNTTTLVFGERPLGAAQIEAIRRFCRERWFDLAWYPGMAAAEANRFNQWQAPWLHEAAARILDERRAAFFDDYKFNVLPATDDRPHFSQFLKWSTLPEIIALRGQGGMPLLEQGYLLLVATLVQALLASVILILLPLAFTRWQPAGSTAPRGRILGYFLGIGMAFMFIEIAFIQKFILFLSHPLYAVAVVLAAFLVFAGLGSALSRRWSRRPGPAGIVGGIAVLSLAYLALLPVLFPALMHLPDAARIALAALLIAPLALLMGMPFPLGLERVAAQAPGWIPWAWGVNGCASVVSAVLATILAIHFGFTVVVLLALVLYALAAWVMPRS